MIIDICIEADRIRFGSSSVTYHPGYFRRRARTGESPATVLQRILHQWADLLLRLPAGRPAFLPFSRHGLVVEAFQVLREGQALRLRRVTIDAAGYEIDLEDLSAFMASRAHRVIAFEPDDFGLYHISDLVGGLRTAWLVP